MNKYVSTVRDFFFPMIDKPSKSELEEEKQKREKRTKEIKERQFQTNEADIILQLAEEYEKREDSRLHEVESKATVFIGIFSVAVTILLGLLKDFLPGSGSALKNINPAWFGTAFCLLLALAIFYLCFAIINSVRTLQKNTFSVLGVKETMNAGAYPSIILDECKVTSNNEQDSVSNRKTEIARKKLLYTYLNEPVINRKVDYMTLAQKFFIHAVVVLIIMIILLALYIIYVKGGVYITNWWNSVSSMFKGSGMATPSNTP